MMTSGKTLENQKPPRYRTGDRVLDCLNRIIKYMKRVRVLSYYIPKNTDKEKEPLLRKYLPPKSGVQHKWNKQQSLARAVSILKQSPEERKKEREE